MTFSRIRLFRRSNETTNDSALIWHENQRLGSTVGSCDIRCLLEGRDSQWTQNPQATEISGLLYFTLEFEEKGVALERGSLTLDVGCANPEPVPIFRTFAPSDAITGYPVERAVQDRLRSDPRLSVTTPFGGGEASGREHEKIIDLIESHRWRFKAGAPSGREDTRVTAADFTWTRTLTEDHSSDLRRYKAALVIHRVASTGITLEAQARVLPAKLEHRIFLPTTGKTRRSLPVGPNRVFLPLNDFEERQRNLQDVIRTMNRPRAAIEMPSVQSAEPPAAEFATDTAGGDATDTDLSSPPAGGYATNTEPAAMLALLSVIPELDPTGGGTGS